MANPLAALMGGSLHLPPIPCGVCVIEAETGARKYAPATMTAVVAGTPACTYHGAQLLAAISSAIFGDLAIAAAEHAAADSLAAYTASEPRSDAGTPIFDALVEGRDATE